MTILITGAHGFIGSHVARACVTNHTVLAPPRSELDLGERSQITSYLARHRPRFLIHLAWYAEHGKFWEASENYDWVDTSLFLAREFIGQGGEKILFMGSCAEYDWSAASPLHEDKSPKKAHTLYGECKFLTGKLLESLCAHYDTRYVWARPFFPYGPGEPDTKLISSLIKVCKGYLPPFAVHHDVRRDFIYIEDLAKAVELLATSNAAGCFNIGSGRGYSPADIARICADSLGFDAAKILDLPTRNPDPHPSITADISRLKAQGWQPQTDFRSGLQKMIDID